MTNDETGLLERNRMRVNILRNSEKFANITFLKNTMPLEIKWLFGWNSEIGLKSISKSETKNDIVIQTFFVSAHVGIILVYDTKKKTGEINTLTGHKNCISSFDADSGGRRFVTVDKGKDSMIIIWDTFRRIPVFTALSPFDTGIALVKFSIDSKYLITVSTVDDGEQTVSFWNLSLGVEEPTCSTKLDSSFGPIVHLACCYDNPNFYCFTTKKLIFFMTSIQQHADEVIELIITIPNRYQKIFKYNYTQSTYVTNSRQVVSASTTGLVTVWDDTDYKASKIKNTSITNDKQFLKNVKLDSHSITTLIYQKNCLITGNINGDVFFYDKSLCVLYHLNVLVGESISSIDLHDVKTTDKKKENEAEMIVQRDNLIRFNSEMSKTQYQNHYRIGTIITAQQEFRYDPLFISTRNCKIFYVDISKDSCIQISEKFGVEPITALEVHPTEFTMIVGNAVGELWVYDYNLKKFITSTTNSQGEAVNNNQVTSIKYSPNGKHLCYGCMDGTFRFLNPHHLTLMTSESLFKWNESPVQHITFSSSANYVVHTDNLFGIYVYRIKKMSHNFTVEYYGCYEVHTGSIRGISMVENKTVLTIYSVGADHKIAIFELDKNSSEDKLPRPVKILITEPGNEPQCMMESTYSKKAANLMIISGSDLRLTVWNDNRCIQTTRGVNLGSPIKIMKKMFIDPSLIVFCNDTDIGILRQPIDGNPYKNAAVLGSGTKIIDFGISRDDKFIFSISEDSASVLMWSIHTSYLDELEKHGGTGLNPYSSLLEGGKNGPEIAQLKEYFYTVQLANSRHPEHTVLKDFVDVCEMSFLMRAMGCYLSEKEISNMIYEINARKKNVIGHRASLVTFEEFVILYVNYKPRFKIKFDEIRHAFSKMVLDSNGKNEILTREAFVHLIQNMGEQISFQEMEIIFHTLLKTTNDISSGSGENIDSILTALPSEFTSEEVISDLFGFQATE